MGGHYFGDAGIFLIKTLFGIYILAVMLRFILGAVRADFRNPISNILIKVTNPPLKPLRRIVPGVLGLDMAAIVLLLALQSLELVLIQQLTGFPMTVPGVMLLSIAQLLSLAIDVFFFSILIQVIISWVNPGTYNPVVSLLYAMNEPLLGRVRRILPPMSGLDLSPLLVMIGLQLLTMLLVKPLGDLSLRLMIG
jgi:YggT family protein